MPARLIVFILTLLVIVTFIGFNIENNSDIRVWFGEKGLIEDVPIFVSFFIMYLIGVLSAVPFVLRWRIKKNKHKTAKEAERESEEPKKKKKTRILGSGKHPQEDAEDSDAAEEEDD